MWSRKRPKIAPKGGKKRPVEEDVRHERVFARPSVTSTFGNSLNRRQFRRADITGDVPVVTQKEPLTRSNPQFDVELDWDADRPNDTRAFEVKSDDIRKKKKRKYVGRTAVRKSHQAAGPVVATIKAVSMIVFIVFVSFGLYYLLPEFSRDALAIENINVSMVPEEFRAEVEDATRQILSESPAYFNFKASDAEKQLTGLFPQIQNLRVSYVLDGKGIAVSGKKRETAALVRNSNSYYLVDSVGFVINKLALGQLAGIDAPHITSPGDFSLIPGRASDSDSLKTCLVLLDVIRQQNPELYKNIEELAYVYRNDEETTGLVMQLRGGLEVRLDGMQPNEDLWKYDVFNAMVLERLRINPQTEVSYVDLRFRRQIPFMLRATERNQMTVPDWAMPLVTGNGSTTSTAEAKKS